MAFPKHSLRVPTSIGTVRIVLSDELADSISPPRQTERAEIQVLDAKGEELEIFRVDLEQHLAANTITQLKQLLTTVRSKAAAELL